MKLVHRCVLWWNMLMMAMFSNVSVSAKTPSSTWRRNTSGRLLSMLFAVLRLFMTSKFYTETWNQQTFSYTRITLLSWEILTSLKLRRKVFCTRRQELLTMLVQKFGRISLMISNLTSGLSVVLFMKCVPWCLHSVLMTWTAYLRKYSKVNTLRFPVTIQWTWDS